MTAAALAASALAAAAPISVDISALTGEEKEKRAKAVKKKLKAVEEVKDKQRGGLKLDAGQVDLSLSHCLYQLLPVHMYTLLYYTMLC